MVLTRNAGLVKPPTAACQWLPVPLAVAQDYLPEAFKRMMLKRFQDQSWPPGAPALGGLPLEQVTIKCRNRDFLVVVSSPSPSRDKRARRKFEVLSRIVRLRIVFPKSVRRRSLVREWPRCQNPAWRGFANMNSY